MIRMSFDISETSSLKRLDGKIIGRFNNKLVRLMLGLYLPKNWHPLVCQESLMTPQSSSQLFLISHPLQPLLVPY